MDTWKVKSTPENLEKVFNLVWNQMSDDHGHGELDEETGIMRCVEWAIENLIDCGELKEVNKMKEVIIRFRYEEEKGKDNNYYRQKAFDEIYNSDDCLHSDHWEVRNTEEKKTCLDCGADIKIACCPDCGSENLK